MDAEEEVKILNRLERRAEEDGRFGAKMDRTTFRTFVHTAIRQAEPILMAAGERHLAQLLLDRYECLNLNSETKKLTLRHYLLDVSGRAESNRNFVAKLYPNKVCEHLKDAMTCPDCEKEGKEIAAEGKK